ncbi:MAG: hypothetical protein JWP91_28 [Fibrobacteres bacterium]|nr:hypothetical protein [Fibrobacterota bacterium]
MLVLPYSQRNMKVIKPFFLGMLGGLVLGLLLLLGLYFTPLRESAYFAVDPEMADIRSKLDQYQEWLAQTDLRIAEHQPASDSLQNAQTKAWRDYKGWRNRLGELARAHAKPTAEGFWPWIFSLRNWSLPIAVLLALLPGTLFALRAHALSRTHRAKAQPKSARAQALSNFEDAIKKVARISEASAGAPIQQSVRREPVPPAAASKRVPIEPPTAVLPIPEFAESPSVPTAPERPTPRDPGRETAFLQMGAPWGEPAGERIGNPASIPPAKPAPDPSATADESRPHGLSMEDEDARDPRDPSAGTRKYAYGDEANPELPPEDGEETLGVMPPTTEVERVERRKAEVLKLARKGMTSSEISRRMRISQDQVEFIIRLRREKG